MIGKDNGVYCPLCLELVPLPSGGETAVRCQACGGKLLLSDTRTQLVVRPSSFADDSFSLVPTGEEDLPEVLPDFDPDPLPPLPMATVTGLGTLPLLPPITPVSVVPEPRVPQPSAPRTTAPRVTRPQPLTPQPSELPDATRVVIAIDFGTSRSGYAFAFTQDGLIHRRTQWPDQPSPYAKTLSQLLCAPDGAVVAWGYTARAELARLARVRKARGYHLLRGFKTKLHTGQPSPAGPTFSGDGHTFKVLELIAEYLRRLKEFALDQLQGGSSGLLHEREVRWILTVPAIWTDADKRWMRVAAERAGLVAPGLDSAARLCLALEPEAAALYCLEQERHADPNFSQLQPGTRFLVVDAGGGTVDITAHQVGPGNSWLEELVPGGGSLHGSQSVDARFREHLEAVLGARVLKRFKALEPLAHAKLLDEWERAKCNYRPGAGVTYVPLPAELYGLLQREEPAVLERLAAAQGGDPYNLCLERQTMEGLFQGALDGVTSRVRRHFRKLGGACDYLFLVGGFAASPLLQQRVQSEFGAQVKKIIVPPDPGAAVVAGAVSYGLDPARIRVRRSRLTYGCRVTAAFEPGVDSEARASWRVDLQRQVCANRFKVFVRAGEAVANDREVLHRFRPPEENRTRATVVFFATPKKDVRYTDEDQVYVIGTLEVAMPDTRGGLGRQLEIGMFFGRTEIQARARDVTTGRASAVALSFADTFLPDDPGA